ncbi:TetR/AcrR family transcriptional regulator [Streptacidiphilus sp. P02-A3a]|uniref:TetR/AcrR family transcriptional regulator n=1 Tax=Streptacidiphilus sp. P02-A3a TaxID=2704468 RepID=UPI0015F7EC55|nr:TetR/AcrR family transcriptional regulator [Streptacidiphilus sp. P02-A3a]QMU73342.1 TetR/AcrR family transcriptional regulator [Streptacidiphilus sp. P02-A3a]
MTQPSTRDRILDSAEQLMRTIGLARATTKQIARAAECSEAALYKYFRSKEEIFVVLLRERMPSLLPLLAELTQRPDDRTPEQALGEIARRATLFYEANMPIAASLFAEPALLQRHREGLAPLGAGPRQPLLSLACYLETLRAEGRIRADSDPEAAAALLLGACFQRAFLRHFAGEAGEPEPPATLDAFATSLARTLLSGI